MSTDYYNRETLDAKMELIHEAVKGVDSKVIELNKKVSYTNGRVRRHEKILLVVGTAVAVLLIVSGSKFVDFAKALAGI